MLRDLASVESPYETMRRLATFFTLRGRLWAEGADRGSTSGGRAVFGRLGKGLMMGRCE